MLKCFLTIIIYIYLNFNNKNNMKKAKDYFLEMREKDSQVQFWDLNINPITMMKDDYIVKELINNPSYTKKY